MKATIFVVLVLTLVGCKSTLVNYALEKKGVYDDKITINKFSKEDSEIVFFQMAHIGTELYYKDAKTKVDSLEKLNFYFYFEKVKSDKSKDTIIRKSIKITGIPLQRNGYMTSLDSILKVKNISLKKKLISQPEYPILGLSESNSDNVDLTLKEIVDYYEKKYSVIYLEPCDFEVSVYENPKCPLKLTKEVHDDLTLTSRNNYVLQTISEEKRKKIAIIYGKGHLKGIKHGLIKMGYSEIN
jgi:hypothetical protein